MPIPQYVVWRPIATAPRDQGPLIVGRAHPEGTQVAFAVPRTPRPGFHIVGTTRAWEPTHWLDVEIPTLVDWKEKS